jgi:transcriptional regulator of heat shock response
VKDNYREFTNKPLASIKFYSWIVDTTLEADHQIFNQHLKVSLEEIIICLKNHQNFMSFFDNPEDFVNSDDNQESFNLQQFIEKIENNTFWEQNLANLKELEKSAVS